MTVTVSWADPRKIALLWTYGEHLTPEAFYSAAEDSLALIEEADSPYYAVADVSRLTHYPTDIVDVLDALEQQAPPTCRGTIFVGVNAVTRTMLLALQRAATQGRRYTMMRSVEEAFDFIEGELSAGRGR